MSIDILNSTKQLELEKELAKLTLKAIIEIESRHDRDSAKVVDLFGTIDSELSRLNVPTNLGEITNSLTAISRANPQSLHRLHFWQNMLEKILSRRVYRVTTVIKIWKRWSFAFIQCREGHEREEILVRDRALENLTNSLSIGAIPTEERHKKKELR